MHALLKAFRGPLTASPVEPPLRFVPAVVYMGVIFFVSSIPGTEITVAFDDRVAHFVEYFILGVLLAFAAAGVRGGTGRTAPFTMLAFVAVHAIADEVHQSLVPSRDASVRDWIFDMLGASAAVYLVRHLAIAKETR